MARWIQLVGAGATGQIGPAGTSGTGVAAPNIVTATAAATYFLSGQVSSFGFAGTITLPTANPDYSHLMKITVRAYEPGSTSGIPICIILRSAFGASSVTYSAGDFTQSQTASTSWTVDFEVENENGAPTGSPLTLTGITVRQSKVSSVSGSEIGTRYAEPVTRLPHLTIGVAPVLNGNQVPQWVTNYISVDNGSHYQWIGAQYMDTVGQTLSIDRLVQAATATWKVASIIGVFPGDAANTITSLPTGAVASSGFSVTGISPPAAGTVTNAVLGTITAKQDYTSGWQWPELDLVSWTETATDSNTWLVKLYVRETNSGGTASGDDRGQWREWTERDMKGGSRDSTPTILQITYRDPAGIYAAYHYLQMQIVTVDRLSVNSGDWSDPTIGTVQTCWSSNTANFIQADYGTLPSGTLPTTRIVNFAADARAAVGPVPTLNYHSTTVSSPTTVTPDISTGSVQGYALGAAVTVALPTNAQVGQEILFDFIQDATGGRVVTLNAGYTGNVDLPWDLTANATTQIRVLVRPGPAYTITGVFTTL